MTDVKETIELTDEQLAKEFNAEILSVAKIAKKYGQPEKKVKSSIARMQRHGILGKKYKSGGKRKVIKPKNGNKTMKGGIEELLKGVNTKIDEESISTLHKEMLVEILHQIIVK